MVMEVAACCGVGAVPPLGDKVIYFHCKTAVSIFRIGKSIICRATFTLNVQLAPLKDQSPTHQQKTTCSETQFTTVYFDCFGGQLTDQKVLLSCNKCNEQSTSQHFQAHTQTYPDEKPGQASRAVHREKGRYRQGDSCLDPCETPASWVSHERPTAARKACAP